MRRLSLKLGFGENAVYQWETHEHDPHLSAVIKLALFFGVSINYMAGAEE